MEKFLQNIKSDLNEISDIQPTISVRRSDLEKLVASYEKYKSQDQGGSISIHEKLNTLITGLTNEYMKKKTSPEELVALTELVNASLKTKNIL